jgi:hypothetical protein
MRQHLSSELARSWLREHNAHPASLSKFTACFATASWSKAYETENMLTSPYSK